MPTMMALILGNPIGACGFYGHFEYISGRCDSRADGGNRATGSHADRPIISGKFFIGLAHHHRAGNIGMIAFIYTAEVKSDHVSFLNRLGCITRIRKGRAMRRCGHKKRRPGTQLRQLTVICVLQVQLCHAGPEDFQGRLKSSFCNLHAAL